MVVALHLRLSCIEGISAAWTSLSQEAREEAMSGQMLWAGVLHELAVGTRIELEVSVLAALCTCVGAACEHAGYGTV